MLVDISRQSCVYDVASLPGDYRRQRSKRAKKKKKKKERRSQKTTKEMKKNRTMLHILHSSKSTKIEQESCDIEARFESKRKGARANVFLLFLSFLLIHFVEEYHTRFKKKKKVTKHYQFYDIKSKAIFNVHIRRMSRAL